MAVSADTTFTATYNSTITDSITVLYDVCFVDYAVTNNKNDNWNTWTGHTVNLTRSETGTLIEPSDNTTGCYHLKYFNSYTNPSFIEFDMKQINGASSEYVFELRGTNNSVIKQIRMSTFTGASVGEWYHYKIDLTNKVIYNTTLNNNTSYTGSPIGAFFSIRANESHTIQYKNFAIY